MARLRAVGERRRLVLTCALAAGVLAAVLVFLVDFQNFMDLRVYVHGGRAWLDDLPLYDDEFGRRVGTGLPFTYPPAAALFFTTLAVLPWALAVAVVTAVSVLALGWVAWLVVRRPAVAVVGLAAAGLLFEPVRLSLSFGQVNLLLMALVVADCLLPRTWWPRGSLIGIAAAVKLTPFAFLLFFAAGRRWRPVWTAGAAFAVVTLVTWALSPATLGEYLSTVLGDPTRIGGLTYVGNQSLNGFWHRLGVDGTAVWVVSVLTVVALGWLAVHRTRAAGDDLGALVATAVAGLLASPVSWSHHWVWAVVALAWVAPRFRTWQWPGRVAAAAGLLLFVLPPHWILPNRYDRELDWSWWQHIVGNEYVWCGLALLLVLAFRRPASGDDGVDSERRRADVGRG